MLNRKRGFQLGALAVLILAGAGVVQSLAVLESRGCFSASVASAPVQIASSPGGVTRFVALGDTGTGKPAQLEVAHAARRICRTNGCDFIALLGDNFYRGGLTLGDTERFQALVQEPYAEFGIPIVAILGNHDLQGSPAAQVMAGVRDPHWRMPDFRYQFQAGAARFYAVNSNCAPLEWLRLAWELRPAAGWQFVLAHHAMHGTAQHGDSDWWSEELWDLLIEDKVHFTLSGHNHVLELLSEPGYPTTYVVAGSSGGAKSKRNEENKKRKVSEAESLFFSFEPGFVWFEVSPGEARVVFYDASGKELYRHMQRKSP